MASLWVMPDLPARSKQELEVSFIPHLCSGVCHPPRVKRLLTPGS